MQTYHLRDFNKKDDKAVNQLALAAYAQYQHFYNDWPALTKIINATSTLSESAELIVAERNKKIIGVVAYVPPGVIKKIFPAEWPVIRMLSVDPTERGQGIGKRLVEECIQRAHRDHSNLIALHTSAIMEAALAMYLKMGFVFEKSTENIFGVEYGIYVKRFATDG